VLREQALRLPCAFVIISLLLVDNTAIRFWSIGASQY
jgi:hypothetical protein